MSAQIAEVPYRISNNIMVKQDVNENEEEGEEQEEDMVWIMVQQLRTKIQ